MKAITFIGNKVAQMRSLIFNVIKQLLEKKSQGSHAMSINCPKCGYENKWEAEECEECGYDLNKSLNQPDFENDNLATTQVEFYEPTYEQSKVESEENAEPVKLIITAEEDISDVDESPTSQPEPETPAFLPTTSVTRLEIDEPEPFIPTGPVTTLELTQAALVKPDSGEKFNLPSGEKLVYIGRVNEEFPVQIDLSGLPNNDIISRVHAVIHVDNDNYYLEDAGSSNGTWLNDEKINPGARFRKQLNSGDIIAFGKHKTITLIFEIDE